MPVNKEKFLDAVRYGTIDEVEAFLKKGASPDEKEDNNGSILAFACWYGKEGLVELLLEYKANPNIGKGKPLYQSIHTPLYNSNIIDMLIEKGAKLDYVYNIDNTTTGNALIASIYFSNPRAAYKLIEKGSDLSYLNKEGFSAFGFAGSSGFKKLGKTILEKGYKPNKKDEYEMEFYEKIQKTKEFHDNYVDATYCLNPMETGKSIHSTGNPDLKKVFIGDHFSGCANLPIHLLTIDLSKIPEFPEAVRKMGVIHAVYQNCDDCDGVDVETFSIEKDGRIKVYEFPDSEPSEEEAECSPESYHASEEMTYLELVKSDNGECNSGIIIGGYPKFAQSPDFTECCVCDKKNFFVGRIYQFKVPPGAEGTGNFIYLSVCPDCKTVTVLRQMT